MKLHKENILYSSSILVVKEERFSFNEFPLHFHPEYELILILKGSGTRFVGDDISTFKDGELCFFGPNLPHTFYNKHLSTDREIHQIVVQFGEDFLGEGFFDRQPFKRIRAFFDKSRRGYSFSKKVSNEIKDRMRHLPQSGDAQMVIELLAILNLLAESTESKFISSTGYARGINYEESERMSEVYEYILGHFREEITLNQIAAIACLSPEAFCRYFKKNTRKTFFEFLIEFRIGHACRLLQENKLSVHQVGLDSGFNNISYFNRKFKAITRKTPVEYQRAFL